MENETKQAKQIQTREQLIYALSLAAELEHGLTCVYLFSAFSMKKFLDEDINEIERGKIRDWQSLIFSVAREEMEHLGLVCNMLNAIGGGQHFKRPNLPQPANYYSTMDAMSLKRFSLENMRDFMDFEKPADYADANADIVDDQIAPASFKFTDHHTVQELYNAIRTGFQNLDANPDVDLFIGPPEAQIEDSDIDVGFGNQEYGITMLKINKLEDALNAIDEIVEQGEGIILDEAFSHDPDGLIIQGYYQKLTGFIKTLDALDFDKENWPKDIDTACQSVHGIIHVLKMSADCIKEKIDALKKARKCTEEITKHYNILCAAIKMIGEGKDVLEKLKKKPPKYSIKNAENVKSICKNQISIPATYDAEGVLLGMFIEKDCHYMRFWNIYQDYKAFLVENPNFEPSRNVVDNPVVRLHSDVTMVDKVFIVEQEYTKKVMELFNAGYEVMVQMLILFFAGENLTDKEKETLMRTAFFPFMTMFIRPVGGVLTQLPAKIPQEGERVERAGPSFEYYINTTFLPHKSQAWTYLHERLEELAAFSNGLDNVPLNVRGCLTSDQLKDVTFEMGQLHNNLKRMRDNFAYGMGLKK